jgi:FtsH-binding integral membrane protein
MSPVEIQEQGVEDHERGIRAGLVRRMRIVYRLLCAALVAVTAWAVAAPAYAATSKHSPHIYTVGRQSTLIGSVIILLICVVSVRRNLRRSPRIEAVHEP